MVLNELAQELRPAAEGVEWFEGLPEDEQRKVLHALVLFCGQARARQDDVPESIARSGVRPTHTPAVMRNGHREKVLTTQAGDLDLAIPKVRTGSFFP
ncbi:DUF5958 family protein, partial [Streptomyces sp. NPDC048231]|uniref:DUF5958 family protein n=1 Tax=Streptomyces sp. NPDC048231 TaxID=3365519 RepID=UPI0037181D14